MTLPSRPPRFLTLLILCSLARPAGAAEVDAEAALQGWLAAQRDLQTWSAEVKQTRQLKTLAQPLVTQGKVWFSRPDRFRWELGHPASTIAVRMPDEMRVYYPGLKRVEVFPLAGEKAATAPWRDAMTLLEAGFPRNREEVESRFRLVAGAAQDQLLSLTLEPRSAGARKLIPKLVVELTASGYELKATELHFSDGSSMRNEFTKAVANPELDPTLLNPELPPDYEVVNPLLENGPPF